MGLISTVLYSYDSEANFWVQNDTTANMVQQTGYDLYPYSDVDLLLGPGSGLAGGLMRQVREVYDYKLKVLARPAQSADLDNYIGSLFSAQDGHDGLDAPEPSKSLADKYAALCFNQAQSPDLPPQRVQFLS